MYGIRRNRGFSLLELMIASAIVGILATIAIPNYMRFQLRARSSEAKTNLSAIRTTEHSYRAEFGHYVAASPSPPTFGGTRPQPFADMGPAGAGFDTVGWKPEGLVYFQYAVVVAGEAYTADAVGDIDGDGILQHWGFLHPDATGTSVAGALGCAGVWDAATASATLVGVLGPCGPDDGQGEF